MARKAISGTRARRNVRIAQMAGLALAVSATALWALQVPGLQGPLPQKPEIANDGQVTTTGGMVEAPAVTRDQVESTSVRLEVAADFKGEQPAPTTPTETPTAAPTGEWRYISAVREPGRTLAVLSRNGKMKILSAGREWEYEKGTKVKVVSVDEEKAVLEEGGRRLEVPRGERTGSAVQWTRMASNAPANQINQANNAMRGMNPQIAARGIDGSQAQRFREEMKARAARRRAGVPEMPTHLLNEVGLTEEDLARMSPDELAETQTKLETMMKERGEDVGSQKADDGGGEKN